MNGFFASFPKPHLNASSSSHMERACGCSYPSLSSSLPRVGLCSPSLPCPLCLSRFFSVHLLMSVCRGGSSLYGSIGNHWERKEEERETDKHVNRLDVEKLLYQYTHPQSSNVAETHDGTPVNYMYTLCIVTVYA